MAAGDGPVSGLRASGFRRIACAWLHGGIVAFLAATFSGLFARRHVWFQHDVALRGVEFWRKV